LCHWNKNCFAKKTLLPFLTTGTWTRIVSFFLAGIYLFAEAILCKALKKEAEAYIHKNFIKMSQEEEFLTISKETLIHFLHSECLHVENEYQVFKGKSDIL